MFQIQVFQVQNTKLPKEYVPPDWALQFVHLGRANQEKDAEKFHVPSLLLSGPPARGKTVVGWIAEQLQLPVIYLEPVGAFSSSPDEIGNRITAAFRSVADTQCVFILEDLDRIAPRDAGDNLSNYARNLQVQYRLITALQDWNDSEHRSLLIATTTAPDNIDDAVRRRFRLQIDMKTGR
jgi:SpoVK/Ycf46/Vps4 family AAA+-type ATPase